MPKAYRVKDWARIFENNRTRNMGMMRWVPVPNKHDGEGFTTLLDHQNGVAHYGAWSLILQVASRCQPRGYLLRADGTRLTAACLAKRFHQPVSLFDEVIPRLLQIGWLEETNISAANKGTYDERQEGDVSGAENRHAPAENRREGATSRHPTDYGMEEEGTEEEEETPLPPKGAGGAELRETLAKLFHPSGVGEHEARHLDLATDRLAAKGATPDEIRRRVGLWSSHYSIPCSPARLVKDWDALDKSGNRGGVAAVAPAAPKVQPTYRCAACGREGFEGEFAYCGGGCADRPLYCPAIARGNCINTHVCERKKPKSKNTPPPASADGALIPEVIDKE